MDQFHWKEQSRLDWQNEGRPPSPDLEFRLIAGAVMRLAQVAESLAPNIREICRTLQLLAIDIRVQTKRSKEKQESKRASRNMIAAMSGQVVNTEPVASLQLSVRAGKAMRRRGIETIGDLIQLSADDLLEIKNFGWTSLCEVRDKLEERSLTLKDDEKAAS